jgi:hypothetical protein
LTFAEMVPQNYYPPPVYVADMMGGSYQQLNGDYPGPGLGPVSTVPMPIGGYQPVPGPSNFTNGNGNGNGPMWNGGSLPQSIPTAGHSMSNGGYYPRTAESMQQSTNMNGQPTASGSRPAKRRSPKVDSDQPLYSTSPLVHDSASLHHNHVSPTHAHPHQTSSIHPPYGGYYATPGNISGSSFQQSQQFIQQSIGGLGITGMNQSVNPNIPVPVAATSYQVPSMDFQSSSVYSAISIDNNHHLTSNGYDHTIPPQYHLNPAPNPHVVKSGGQSGGQPSKVSLYTRDELTVYQTRKPFTTAQSAFLENYRLTNPTPNNEEKNEIARAINDTLPRVHNWFLNQYVTFKSRQVLADVCSKAKDGKTAKSASKIKSKTIEEQQVTLISKSPTKSSSRRGSKVSPISISGYGSASGSGSGNISREPSTTDLGSASMSMSATTSSDSISYSQNATFDNLRIGQDGYTMVTAAQNQASAQGQGTTQQMPGFEGPSQSMLGYDSGMDGVASSSPLPPVQTDYTFGNPPGTVPNFTFGAAHPTANTQNHGPAIRIDTNLAPVDRMTGLDDFASQHHLPAREPNDHYRRRSSLALGHTDPNRAGGPFSALAMNAERSNPYPSTAARRGSLLPPRAPLRSLSMAPPVFQGQGQGQSSTPPSPYTPNGSGSRRNSAQFIPSPWTPRTRTASVTPNSAIRSGGRRVSRMLSMYDKTNTNTNGDIFESSAVTIEEGGLPTAIGVPIQETQIKSDFTFGTATASAPLPNQDQRPDEQYNQLQQQQAMAPPTAPARQNQDQTIQMDDGSIVPIFDQSGTSLSPEILSHLVLGLGVQSNEGQGPLSGTGTGVDEQDQMDTDDTTPTSAGSSGQGSGSGLGLGLGLDANSSAGIQSDEHLEALGRSCFPELELEPAGEGGEAAVDVDVDWDMWLRENGLLGGDTSDGVVAQ